MCLYLLLQVCSQMCYVVSLHPCVCVVCLAVQEEREKPIDYFNPPICESVILSAEPSTGGLLMGLNASLLSPLSLSN